MSLLLRADASEKIGTGHVMRCLALAQGCLWAAGEVVFAMATEAPALEKRISGEGFALEHLVMAPGGAEDAAAVARLAKEKGATWVVVDGYHFSYDYQRMLKDAGARVLLIDDNGRVGRYCADIVLDQNLCAEEAIYADHEPHTRLLLGTRYVLLRREFWPWKGQRREIPDVARRILIAMGGADSDNVTLKVVNALGDITSEDLEAVVVVGGSNPHYEELQAAAGDSRARVRLERNVANMPELMAWGDVAVCGGGVTVSELMFMGLPSILLVTAENQRGPAVRLEAEGAAIGLGWHADVQSADISSSLMSLLSQAERRAQMSSRGQLLVDGKGAHRVAEAMRAGRLTLRRTRESDRRLIWEWANDPEVRRSSFSSDAIPWQRHVEWFGSKMGDANCVMFIVADAEQHPVGQVRHEISQHETTISVSVSREHRGKGYGAEAIRMACQELFAGGDVEKAHAYVKKGNESSIRSFRKAGFTSAGVAMVKGYEAVHLVLDRNESP